MMDDARLLRIGTLSFHSNDLNETISIHEYMFKLLSTLWEEQDGFSGKRPFGADVHKGCNKHTGTYNHISKNAHFSIILLSLIHI